MEKELLTLAEQAIDIAQKAGANNAIARVQDNNSTTFVFRDGKVEETRQNTSRGLSVQLYVDGRYSSHQTSDLRPNMLAQFVADAVVLTRHLSTDPYRVIPDTALYANRPQVSLDLNDTAVRDLPREVCLDWLKAMDVATHQHNKVISATGRVYYGWHTSARMSSNGFSGTRTDTSIGYGANITLDDGSHGRPEAGRYVNGCYLSDLPKPDAVAQEGLQRAIARLGSQKDVSTRAVMVVDPEAGGRLIGAIWQALYAQSIQQNRSFLSGKLNVQIASKGLTITDDPLLRRGQGSRLYDGEGISAKSMPIVENGILRNYYIDTYYGRKLGWTPTTGSSSNLIFALGNKDRNALISDIDRGFCVTSWLGGNSDPTTGDFSFGFRGHRIAQGQLGAPVSEMNITGNLHTLLNSLIAVGDDPNIYSSMRTPTLVFDGVDFSGK